MCIARMYMYMSIVFTCTHIYTLITCIFVVIVCVMYNVCVCVLMFVLRVNFLLFIYC